MEVSRALTCRITGESVSYPMQKSVIDAGPRHIFVCSAELLIKTEWLFHLLSPDITVWFCLHFCFLGSEILCTQCHQAVDKQHGISTLYTQRICFDSLIRGVGGRERGNYEFWDAYKGIHWFIFTLTFLPKQSGECHSVLCSSY